MKKLYLLMAIFACLELAIVPRIAQALSPQSDEKIEETIEDVGQEIENALEEIAESFGMSAERMGQHFERWAEDHADELDDWSDKYGAQWENWANRFGRKMERFGRDQENVWGDWARQYEKNWQRWAEELESEEVDARAVGELVERNLKMLSKMPLGKMVEQLLDDGLGELSEAPWDSLEELGRLAERALDEPLNELTEMADEGSEERQAMEKGVRDLRDALGRIGNEVQKQLGEEIEQQRISERDRLQARVRALQELLGREQLTDRQRAKIEQLIKTLRDAEAMLAAESDRDLGDMRSPRPRRDQPRGRAVRGDRDRDSESASDKDSQRERKMRSSRAPAEKKSAAPAKGLSDEDLERFNDDLRRSSKESRQAEQKRKELESRRPKRADGKDLDPDSKTGQKKDALRWFSGERNSKEAAKTDKETVSELQLLRQEIEKLRRQIEELKKSKGKDSRS